MAKRKADTKDGEASKKVAPRKIPKLLKAKILMLLSEAEVAVDSPTIKLFLDDKYDYPDSVENKNKVWKALKELRGESSKRVDFGFVNDLYHGGKESASYLALTPEDFQKHEEAKKNKKVEEKFTCPHCQAYDYYCQAGETVPGEFPGSEETEYKCLNECFRMFTVTVHGNKRIYKFDEGGFGDMETKEETIAEDSIHFIKFVEAEDVSSIAAGGDAGVDTITAE